MENEIKDKSIYEVLKKLVDLECNNAKVEAITFAKKGSRLVSTKVNDMQECIVENAREYGKKLEFVNETAKIKSAIEANIIRNYTISLEKVNKQFDIKYKTILEKELELKNKDTEALMLQDSIAKLRDEAKKAPEYAREKELQEQAKIAIDEGNYDKLEEINKELREISKVNKATKYEAQVKQIRAERAKIAQAIEKCAEELEKCTDDRRQAIELIAGKKENLLQTADKKYMVVLQNQNWIQKTWGRILNVFNGSKRYTDNVTNVLTKKVRDIEYKSIPKLREKLQNETEEVLIATDEMAGIVMDPVIEKKDKVVEKGKEIAIKGINKATEAKKYVGKKIEKAKETAKNVKNKAWNSSKQTYNSLLGRYRSARMWGITKMEERIAKLENKEVAREQKEDNITKQEETEEVAK